MRVLKLYQIKLTQLMVDGHAFTHVMRDGAMAQAHTG